MDTAPSLLGLICKDTYLFSDFLKQHEAHKKYSKGILDIKINKMAT